MNKPYHSKRITFHQVARATSPSAGNETVSDSLQNFTDQSPKNAESRDKETQELEVTGRDFMGDRMLKKDFVAYSCMRIQATVQLTQTLTVRQTTW